MSTFFEVLAGSGYGWRTAIYQVVKGVLVLVDPGESDNLAGNSIVLDFEGLTSRQARKRINAINSEPVGHSFYGCHACYWSVGIRRLSMRELPEWLTYIEPAMAEVIRTAIDEYCKTHS